MKKQFNWSEWERKKKEATKHIKEKIRELQEKSGINKLLKEMWEIEKKIEKEKWEKYHEWRKSRIKKGMKVVLTGGTLAELELLHKKSEIGIVLRKNKNTATIKFIKGYYKGKTLNRKYEDIDPLTTQ